MLHKNRYYIVSIIFTVIIYVVIGSLLLISIEYTPPSQPAAAPQPKIVHAVTINQTKVEAEIHKIKAEKAAKRAAEIARQRHLEKLARQARMARIREAKRLDALRRQQQKIEASQRAEKIAAHKKLMQMKRQQQQAKQKLDQLKKQQAAMKVQQQSKLAHHKAAFTKAQIAKAQLERAEKNLKKQIAEEQKQISATQARHIQREVEKYKNLILNAIGQRWIMPKNIDKHLSTLLLIRLASGGTVLNVQILKSSGNDILDRSVVTAVWKASPLPVPTDATVFDQFRELHLTVKPQGLLS